MAKHEFPPDYACPYCGVGHDADYGTWEDADFEAEADIECIECGKTFRVNRTFIAYYDVMPPCDSCTECPESDESGMDWKCKKNGCEKVTQ